MQHSVDIEQKKTELKLVRPVPENIHTPPMYGIGISLGGDSVKDHEIVKKCKKLYWNSRGGGGVGTFKRVLFIHLV